MFYAEMQTEHFTFRAVASYRDEAKRAIVRGWKRHVEQYVAHHKTAWDGRTANELEEWYGINVYEIEVNECLRDDTVLGVK